MEGKTLEELSREELTKLGFGGYGVENILHCLYTLPDGTRIALRIWCPSNSIQSLDSVKGHVNLIQGDNGEGGAYPTVLEYLPYRKADFTAERDHRRHPWLASHGYVVVRADMRGSGDSDGVYYDEYLQQELDDCCNLIGWISEQPWSNGKVGMYGKSWGGFNGLMVAYQKPPALSAVISLYSTDDRFEDDIHWKGGCVLGGGMLSWASTMFCWDARPPHPQYNPKWKETWKQRLEAAGNSCLSTWLGHQTYDQYWRHGSIKENYDNIQIPVLSIGGWHDGYTNANLRMAKKLPNCKAIIGPWSHNWPDTAIPGPNIAFMDECLQFWNEHLKGVRDQNQVKWQDTPQVRWFQCNGVIPPGPSVMTWPGQWQCDQEANGDGARVVFTISDDNKLCPLDSASVQQLSRPIIVPFSGSAGLFCGEWLSFGAPDLAGDQRHVAGQHGSWFSGPLKQDLHMFGQVEVTCQLGVQSAHVFVSLCHVMNTKGGGHRLLTYGVKNISAEDSGSDINIHDVCIQLDVIGYTVPAGDGILIMIGPGSFPTIWPTAQPGKIVVHSGNVSLPTCQLETVQDGKLFAREDMVPRLGPEKNVEVLRKDSFNRDLQYSLSDNKRSIRVKTDEGCKYFPDVETEIDEVNEDVYSIVGDDPLTAEAYSYRSCTITYQARNGKNPIKTETVTKSWMKCNETEFLLENNLRTSVNGEDFYSNIWNETVARNHL